MKSPLLLNSNFKLLISILFPPFDKSKVYKYLNKKGRLMQSPLHITSHF